MLSQNFSDVTLKYLQLLRKIFSSFLSLEINFCNIYRKCPIFSKHFHNSNKIFANIFIPLNRIKTESKFHRIVVTIFQKFLATFSKCLQNLLSFFKIFQKFDEISSIFIKISSILSRK